MGAVVSLLGGRALAWLVLGGGGLVVLVSLWTGAKHKGAVAEAGKWQSAIRENVRETRDANHRVDGVTNAESNSLQQQERAIREKWATMGRAPAAAAAKQESDK